METSSNFSLATVEKGFHAKMKTIVHIGYGGGVTTMMKDLSTAIPDVQFITLTFGPATIPTAPSSTSFVWQGQFRLDQYVMNIGRLYRWLRTTTPDLVVLHGFIPMALISIPAKRAGVQRVVGIDVGPQPTYWLVKKIIFWFSRHALTAVASVGEESAAWFQRYYPWFRRRVKVINNGVDLPHQVPTRIRLQHPPYVISTLSRIEAPQKDPMTLLKAGILLRQRNIPIDIRFVGDGNLVPLLKKEIIAGGLQDSVHYLGYRADYQSVFDETDIFVLSTNWEGMALSLLAAMANGIPTIATKVIGNTGVIADGQTGRLFQKSDHVQLADIITEFIADSETARELGAKAASVVQKKYLRSRMIAEYQQWFINLLSDESQPSATKPRAAI